ncbi:MAG: molecular chaperone TorD family protein [Nitrospirae bacterium]|nr:molecular chaperone TorD family protein [Nitrospirota bacterium]
MALLDVDKERAEAYRVLADIFFSPPANDVLKAMKEDFGLESKENEFGILEDFNALFLYPDGKLPPLESLYILDEDTTAEDITAELEAAYAEAGLTIDEDFLSIPDHISLEFLFMSYLIDSEKPDLQRKFLEAHLMNWIPYYCEEVRKQSATVFYKEIADITSNFIEGEYEGLQ